MRPGQWWERPRRPGSPPARASAGSPPSPSSRSARQDRWRPRAGSKARQRSSPRRSARLAMPVYPRGKAVERACTRPLVLVCHRKHRERAKVVPITQDDPHCPEPGSNAVNRSLRRMAECRPVVGCRPGDHPASSCDAYAAATGATSAGAASTGAASIGAASPGGVSAGGVSDGAASASGGSLGAALVGDVSAGGSSAGRGSFGATVSAGVVSSTTRAWRPEVLQG